MGNRSLGNHWVGGKSQEKKICRDSHVGVPVCLSVAIEPCIDVCISIYRGHMPHTSISNHEPRIQAGFLTEWHSGWFRKLEARLQSVYKWWGRRVGDYSHNKLSSQALLSDM